MSSVKHKTIIFCTLFAIVLLFGFISYSGGEEADLFEKIGAKQMKVKKPAPNFSLEDLNGQKVILKNLKGKVIFLNFWATWCSPCKGEMPSLETLWQWYKGKDFLLLGIAVDYAGVKTVKEYIERQHYTFRVLIDSRSKTLDRYEVKAIPTTLMIDKKGQIVAVAVGPRNWRSPEAASLVELLIKR